MEIYRLLFGNVMCKYTSTLKAKSATKQKGTHSLATQRDSEVYLSQPKLAKIQKNTQLNHRALSCRSLNGLTPLSTVIFIGYLAMTYSWYAQKQKKRETSVANKKIGF